MGDDALREAADLDEGAIGLIVPLDDGFETGLEGVFVLQVLVELADIDVDEADLLDQVAKAGGVEAGDVPCMDADGGSQAEATRRVGRAHAQGGGMMVAFQILDMEMAVEGEGVAVVVAAPAALVPALRLVEGVGDAPGNLEELLG